MQIPEEHMDDEDWLGDVDNWRPTMMVHDEVTFEVPEGRLDLVPDQSIKDIGSTTADWDWDSLKDIMAQGVPMDSWSAPKPLGHYNAPRKVVFPLFETPDGMPKPPEPPVEQVLKPFDPIW